VVEHIAARLHRVVVPEMNMGQLALEVERVVGKHKVRRVNKADGEMIQPSEILAAIEERELRSEQTTILQWVSDRFLR